MEPRRWTPASPGPAENAFRGIAYRGPSWAETYGIRTDTNIRSGAVTSGRLSRRRCLQSGSRPCANLHRATNLTARFNCCISEPALQSLQGAHLIVDRDSHLDEFRRKAVQSVGNPGVKRGIRTPAH